MATVVLVGGSRDGESTVVDDDVRRLLAHSDAPGLLDVYEPTGERTTWPATRSRPRCSPSSARSRSATWRRSRCTCRRRAEAYQGPYGPDELLPPLMLRTAGRTSSRYTSPAINPMTLKNPARLNTKRDDQDRDPCRLVQLAGGAVRRVGVQQRVDEGVDDDDEDRDVDDEEHAVERREEGHGEPGYGGPADAARRAASGNRARSPVRRMTMRSMRRLSAVALVTGWWPSVARPPRRGTASRRATARPDSARAGMTMRWPRPEHLDRGSARRSQPRPR